jgi:hypothetical protein
MRIYLPKIAGISLFLLSTILLSGCEQPSIHKETVSNDDEIARSQNGVSTETPISTPTIKLTITPQITSTISALASTTPTPVKPPETEVLFNNYNGAGVQNNPTAPTVFTLKTAKKISTIQDYHWNSAKGKTPGTIGLKSENGTMYGPWNAKGDPGQGGVPDAYWTVYPDTEIPAGTYTIIDSDPASWAQNFGTKGLGMSQVYAVK